MDDSRKESDCRLQYPLIIGVLTGIVMMGISYLMDGYGLLSEEQTLSLRPLWVYTLCMTLAMIGVPVMCWALFAWLKILRDISAEKWVQRLFIVSAMSYAVSSLYLIAIDCLPPVVFQNAQSLGMTAESAVILTRKIQEPFAIPIVVYFLIEDIGISIVLWRLILTGNLALSKWALFLCPVPMLLIDVLLKLIPSAFAKNVSVMLESFGWLLFMLAGLLHYRKMSQHQ